MPTAQRGHGNGADVQALDEAHQVLQTYLNVCLAAACSPVPLGGEVDDPARATYQATHVKHMHLAQLHLARLASAFIGAKHLGVRLFELQRNALAHDAHRVDSVHQCLHGRIQQVAFGGFNHVQ